MLEYYRYKFHPIVIKVDDDPTPKKGYFMIICNTKYYGGKFVISDKTDPADGRLDICLIKNQGLFTAIKCSVQLALGKIKKGPMVEKFQCKKVHIRAFGRHRMHCDAEYIGQRGVRMRISKQSTQHASEHKQSSLRGHFQYVTLPRIRGRR